MAVETDMVGPVHMTHNPFTSPRTIPLFVMNDEPEMKGPGNSLISYLKAERANANLGGCLIE